MAAWHVEPAADSINLITCDHLLSPFLIVTIMLQHNNQMAEYPTQVPSIWQWHITISGVELQPHQHTSIDS